MLRALLRSGNKEVLKVILVVVGVSLRVVTLVVSVVTVLRRRLVHIFLEVDGLGRFRGRLIGLWLWWVKVTLLVTVDCFWLHVSVVWVMDDCVSVVASVLAVPLPLMVVRKQSAVGLGS